MKIAPLVLGIFLLTILVIQATSLSQTPGDLSLSVPQKNQIGDEVPIKFTMENGNQNFTYEIEFQVKAPDDQMFNVSKEATPDLAGKCVVEVAYPNSFSNAKQAVGNYTVEVTVYHLVENRKDLLFDTPLVEPFQINEVNSLTAAITSITPNPATAGQLVEFSGSGNNDYGNIHEYNWTSNIDGFLSDEASFSTASLSVGSHSITFQVQYRSGYLSQQVTTTLIINPNESSNTSPNEPQPSSDEPQPTSNEPQPSPNETRPDTNATNIIPTAYIDSSAPASVTSGQAITFSGHGTDPDGTITAYRWDSNIDGTFATTRTTTVSNLSEGTHDITFRVQDDSGEWSNSVAMQITVANTTISSGSDLTTLAVIAGCIALAAGIASYSTIRIRQQKNKEQKPRPPKIHKLSLDVKLPSILTSGAATQVGIKVKNTGTAKLSNVMLKALATPGLAVTNPLQSIRKLDIGKQVSVSFPVALDKKLDRGFYTFRLETKSKGFPVLPKSFPIRVFKIGMLVQSSADELELQLGKLLQTRLYTFDPLPDSSSLSNGILNYDMLIVPPKSELSLQAAKNLASYVYSGQSVLLIGEIQRSNTHLFEDIFGYTNHKLPSLRLSTVKINDNQHHPLTKEFQPREFQIVCKESSWKSQTTTAQTLAMHCNPRGNPLAPAITTNTFGRGRVIHFNFEPEIYDESVWVLLKNSVDWLLKD